jgi:hypothetical protein
MEPALLYHDCPESLSKNMHTIDTGRTRVRINDLAVGKERMEYGDE